MNTHNASGSAALPVVINNVPLMPIEVDGARVVTLAMIDKVHDRREGTAGRIFRENRGRLVEGEDYRELTADEIRRQSLNSVFPPRTPKGIVFTETGYLMLVKSLTDDLAWSVQRSLVKSYFVKQANDEPRLPHVDASREFRLSMNLHLKLARMAGLVGNQALLSANAATAKLTGIDALKMLGSPALLAPQNDALLTPTEIGRRTGIGSPRAVNARLCLLGLQWQFKDTKDRPYYEPTDAGLAAGAVMQDVGKSHGDGTPVRQLKWASSIIGFLKGKESAA
jgi:hypothetical protein